ncbi:MULTISPECIES: hypothetical protein [Bacillales]|uniref:Peptidase M4 n=1 Tax=Lysinibacillus louembei TaxID=1470088 RepID=A0ABZ0RUQ0_9BACI|nr:MULTISPECIES: hypothetical protein [Bacillales]MCT6925825.1 hypothetical protein [Metasolibacillus sp.]MCT6941982.1 hypothetical protein [Metasolibacillus sp.]WPK10563.1 hypothetical protein R6U77_11780 [Lysinibacillus louembei]
MKLRDFVLGVATGLAAAIIIKEVSERVDPYLSADTVLQQIKAEFKKEAPIDGSWVFMKVEEFSNGFTTTPVYRGGISRMMNGEMESFEFAADARSGAVLELTKL